MDKTKLWITIGIIVVVVIAIVFVFYFQQTPTEKPIKIGVLGDLSGDYAHVFRGCYRGTEPAVEDIRKEIGVEIQLIIEDQRSCDAKETVTIMRKFVDIDRVDFIVGGTCSSTTLAAAPIANSAKVVMISPASSAPSVTYAGDYVFRTYISDILRAREGAKLAYGLGKRRMAIITEVTNDACIEINRGAKEEFLKLGGEVVADEEITRKDTDFRTQLTKIKNPNPDVLLMSITGPNQIGLVAKQARELDLNVQLIIPVETVEDPAVIEVAGDAVEGLIYVMPGNPPETPKYQELKERYSEKYPGDEIPMYLTESYDATVLGVRAVLASNGTREDIKNKLYEVSKTYEGVSGNVTFDENGDVVKSAIFKTIKNGEFVLYEK